MKYLKKIETENDICLVTERPNLVLINDTKRVLYNAPTAGVSIQHINGQLYTADEWSAAGFAKAEANGVAIIDPRASFVIAPSSLQQKAWSGNSSTAVPGLPTLSQTAAATDYAGFENTQLILADGDTIGAAYACANYTFNNGKKGYLPSYGEALVYTDYIDDARAAFSKIGASSSFLSSNTWTSSQSSSTYAWFMWSSGASSASKSRNYTVWPVTQLSFAEVF